MNDAELIKKCIHNEMSAQKYLFDRFSRKMMGVCLRYVDLREEADDILQEGFIKVFRNLSAYRGEGSLEGWIRKIMVNEALTYLRKNKKMKSNISLHHIEVATPASSLAGDTLNEKDLLKIITQLPPGYRTVFNLYAIEGYSHKEIADRLGISEGTSKSQYSRARTLLQSCLALNQ
jgi:RNA polymerase sigma-70 factor (ECF subfamily)